MTPNNYMQAQSFNEAELSLNVLRASNHCSNCWYDFVRFCKDDVQSCMGLHYRLITACKVQFFPDRRRELSFHVLLCFVLGLGTFMDIE